MDVYRYIRKLRERTLYSNNLLIYRGNKLCIPCMFTCIQMKSCTIPGNNQIIIAFYISNIIKRRHCLHIIYLVSSKSWKSSTRTHWCAIIVLFSWLKEFWEILNAKQLHQRTRLDFSFRFVLAIQTDWNRTNNGIKSLFYFCKEKC